MTAPTRATKQVESRRFVTVLTAALLTLAALLGCGLGAAPAALADPNNCETIAWGFLGSQRRTICDGPIKADGSWLRGRMIWTPAHYVPLTTTCFGGYYSATCTSYGGYAVDLSVQSKEYYPVTPDTVLSDEPGHLGPGQLPELR